MLRSRRRANEEGALIWKWKKVFMDTIVNVIGIIYGIILILAAFVRNRVMESMRVDALFIPQPTETTRPMNLVVGILVAGYGIYSLLSR
jgi:hypothetical protein